MSAAFDRMPPSASRFLQEVVLNTLDVNSTNPCRSRLAGDAFAANIGGD
jgi:hypothetical protein